MARVASTYTALLLSRYLMRNFICINSFFLITAFEVGSIVIVSVLQMRKLRCREVK